jgi:hypothetical protein
VLLVDDDQLQSRQGGEDCRAGADQQIAVAAAGEDAGRRAELSRRRSKLVEELRRAEATGPGQT